MLNIEHRTSGKTLARNLAKGCNNALQERRRCLRQWPWTHNNQGCLNVCNSQCSWVAGQMLDRLIDRWIRLKTVQLGS